MRSKNEFYFRMLFYKMNPFSFIIFPGTSGNNYFLSSAKICDAGNLCKIFSNIDYPVTSRIPGNCNFFTGNYFL